MSGSSGEFEQEIERISAIIATARDHLESGRSVDLAALEDRVRDLCDRVAEAPPGAPAPLKEALERLSADLDDLENDLIARQDAHTEPLHEASHRRASRIYGRKDEET